MFEIMLLPHSLHIKYDAADDSESVSISTVEYLFIRHAVAMAGFTELPDGTWTEAPAN